MEDMNDWRTSSYSGNGGECVEVGNGDQSVMIRDSKARGTGTLRISADDWRKLTDRIKASN